MYCKNCGRELDEGAKFCTYCGTQTSMAGRTSGSPSDSQNQKQTDHMSGARSQGQAGYSYQAGMTQTTATNQTNSTGSKKKGLAPVVIGIFIVFIFCCGVAGFIFGSRSKSDSQVNSSAVSNSEEPSRSLEADTAVSQNVSGQASETEVTENTEETVSSSSVSSETGTSASSATEITNVLFYYTATIDGVDYTFPCELSEFEANGWTIKNQSDESKVVAGNDSEDMIVTKDGNLIYLCMHNYSGNQQPIKDCTVYGFYFWKENVESMDISFPNDVTIDSTVDEIIEAYGEADLHNTRDEYVGLYYYPEGSVDNDHYVNFTVYTTEDMQYSNIAMKNLAELEVDTETVETVPAYLADYVKPTELGTDLLEGTISIEGDLYRFPCPLTEFTDNGWNIEYEPDAVASGDTDYILISKNGKSQYVYVENFSEYQTTAINCAVIYVDTAEGDGIDIQLSNEISIGTEKTLVDSVITDDFDFNESTYGYNHYPYGSDEKYVWVFIYFDENSDLVDRIIFQSTTWDY